MENWSIKGIPVWDMALWKSLWERKGYIKVDYVNAHKKNSLPELEVDWYWRADILVYLLEMATWVHEMSGHWRSVAMQRWAESRYIPLTL